MASYYVSDHQIDLAIELANGLPHLDPPLRRGEIALSAVRTRGEVAALLGLTRGECYKAEVRGLEKLREMCDAAGLTLADFIDPD